MRKKNNELKNEIKNEKLTFFFCDECNEKPFVFLENKEAVYTIEVIKKTCHYHKIMKELNNGEFNDTTNNT